MPDLVLPFQYHKETKATSENQTPIAQELAVQASRLYSFEPVSFFFFYKPMEFRWRVTSLSLLFLISARCNRHQLQWNTLWRPLNYPKLNMQTKKPLQPNCTEGNKSVLMLIFALALLIQRERFLSPQHTSTEERWAPKIQAAEILGLRRSLCVVLKNGLLVCSDRNTQIPILIAERDPSASKDCFLISL